MTSNAWMITTAGAFGALFGSFLNVVIFRLPRHASVVVGRSQCPHCREVIRWFDNVPIASWVALGGRCRRCRWKIPFRYPLVELLSGLGAAVAVWHFGPTLQAAWVYAFVAIMIAITFIDWEHQIIPDALSLGGTLLGWIGAWVCLDVSVVDSLLGAGVGAGIILAIAYAYKAARKVEGMGGGDVKLMAMIGAFLGWQMVLVVLFLAAFAGSVYGVWLMRSERGDGKTAVAFGAFLAPAACLMLFSGGRLLSLYLGAFSSPR